MGKRLGTYRCNLDGERGVLEMWNKTEGVLERCDCDEGYWRGMMVIAEY